MNDRIIEFEPLIEGTLIKRYKRFLADIQIDNGEIVEIGTHQRLLKSKKHYFRLYKKGFS